MTDVFALRAMRENYLGWRRHEQGSEPPSARRWCEKRQRGLTLPQASGFQACVARVSWLIEGAGTRGKQASAAEAGIDVSAVEEDMARLEARRAPPCWWPATA